MFWIKKNPISFDPVLFTFLHFELCWESTLLMYLFGPNYLSSSVCVNFLLSGPHPPSLKTLYHLKYYIACWQLRGSDDALNHNEGQKVKSLLRKLRCYYQMKMETENH